MPDQNQQTNTNENQVPTSNDNFVVPNQNDTAEPIIPNIPDVADAPADVADVPEVAPVDDANGPIAEIINKIAESHNILVALSSDPSVDEISSAIGLSLFLDKLGKRATAIYSGTTPNALEFLKPEETFETTADTLQDFVIAINKEKADHLRYKLDGDYVRIYITPYKTKVAKEDLEFSYGDFNVDLVLALDVANGVDLDSALREHGRIMHDASVVNITTGNPGKLGEIEWSDKTASSVAEMLTKLIFAMGAKDKLDREEATAFLTGIVAATNRFSAPNTTSETMQVASKLMESGADQQLISKNISTELESELFGTMSNMIEQQKEADPTALDIKHEDETKPKKKSKKGAKTEAPVEEPAPVAEVPAEEPAPEVAPAEPEPEPVPEPELPEVPAELTPAEEPAPAVEAPVEEPTPEVAPAEPEPGLLDDLKAAADSLANTGAEVTPEVAPEPIQINSAETVIAPSPEFTAAAANEGKYTKMFEDALNEPTVAEQPAPAPAPIEQPVVNPAASVAPTVATEPDVANLPEINYAADGDMLLPPPPTPPIDFDANSLPTPPAGPAPDMPPMPGDMPPDFDPSSFQIPGL